MGNREKAGFSSRHGWILWYAELCKTGLRTVPKKTTLKIASWGDCRESWIKETQFSSIAQSCLALCNPMDWSMPGFHVHHQLWSLLKLMSIESVMPSNHLVLFIPFSSCLQPFPASGSFPKSQFFTSGSPSIRVWASASVLSMNIQDWFPLR